MLDGHARRSIEKHMQDAHGMAPRTTRRYAAAIRKQWAIQGKRYTKDPIARHAEWVHRLEDLLRRALERKRAVVVGDGDGASHIEEVADPDISGALRIAERIMTLEGLSADITVNVQQRGPVGSVKPRNIIDLKAQARALKAGEK